MKRALRHALLATATLLVAPLPTQSATATVAKRPAFAAPAAATAEMPDPWVAIGKLRHALEGAGMLDAAFVQTYVPAGFKSGEREEGVLAIALPDCLRWDYDEPFSKTFILCNDQAYYWNPGETIGQRYLLDGTHTPGLDFFLLELSELEERYIASAMEEERPGPFLRLVPHEPSEDLVEAELELDEKSERIVGLTYVNAEGGRTHFEIASYRSSKHDTTFFSPPSDIEWRDP